MHSRCTNFAAIIFGLFVAYGHVTVANAAELRKGDRECFARDWPSIRAYDRSQA
jgi:hypothetical protein